MTQTLNPPIKSRRIIELDALRALAAINLLLFHFTHVYQVKYGYVGSLGFELPYGKYGVQLFFMLSGFVNAMTILKKRDASDFVVNRLVRIYPAFWMVVMLNVLLFSVAPIHLGTLSTQQVFANFTAIPGLFGEGSMEPVTWTIQVEMLFYGIILVLFLTGALDKPLRTIAVLVTFSLVGCLCMDYMASINPDAYGLSFLTFFRGLLILDYLPLFAIGMLLHEIYSGRSGRWANIGGVVFSAIVFHVIDDHGHNPVVTIGFIGLLTASAYGKLPVLRLKPFVFISTISYALYLMHNNLGCVLIYYMNHAGIHPLVCMVAVTALMTVVAALFTYKLEQPLTRFLKTQWQHVKPSVTQRCKSINQFIAHQINSVQRKVHDH